MHDRFAITRQSVAAFLSGNHVDHVNRTYGKQVVLKNCVFTYAVLVQGAERAALIRINYDKLTMSFSSETAHDLHITRTRA